MTCHRRAFLAAVLALPLVTLSLPPPRVGKAPPAPPAPPQADAGAWGDSLAFWEAHPKEMAALVEMLQQQAVMGAARRAWVARFESWARTVVAEQEQALADASS